jgi:hypothetical protein
MRANISPQCRAIGAPESSFWVRSIPRWGGAWLTHTLSEDQSTHRLVQGVGLSSSSGSSAKEGPVGGAVGVG